MKKFAFFLTGLLLAMSMLSVGCTKATLTLTPAQTQNVTGNLTNVLTSPSGNATLTIQTPQGTQTIPVTENTTYSLNGRTCLLSEVGKAVAEANTTLVCTVVVAAINPYGGEGAGMAVYVSQNATQP